MEKNKISYEDAFTELQKISDQLVNDNIGIDELTNKLKRANELIKICRAQLKKTEEETNKVLEQLED
ncbi:MAG: exodeoxyribonuclease VII small subunit [Bacteroidales bacterium]|jgi:exodeoxyribonuclease VII small subunit